MTLLKVPWHSPHQGGPLDNRAWGRRGSDQENDGNYQMRNRWASIYLYLEFVGTRDDAVLLLYYNITKHKSVNGGGEAFFPHPRKIGTEVKTATLLSFKESQTGMKVRSSVGKSILLTSLIDHLTTPLLQKMRTNGRTREHTTTSLYRTYSTVKYYCVLCLSIYTIECRSSFTIIK